VLFSWIAANIRYDVDKFLNPPPRPRFEGRTKAEMEANAKEWHEKQVAQGFQSEKGRLRRLQQNLQNHVRCGGAGMRIYFR
jgi:hypothetical protein